MTKLTDDGASAAPRGFGSWLTLLLVGSMTLRIAYVIAQPASDPSFSIPILDGKIYADWAKSILAGDGGPLALGGRRQQRPPRLLDLRLNGLGARGGA